MMRRAESVGEAVEGLTPRSWRKEAGMLMVRSNMQFVGVWCLLKGGRIVYR
jgi:hypothetical protein